MKLFHKTLYALTFLLLTGCVGLADMAYNNAPRYVAGEIDDAFDLNPAQSDQLDTRLQQFFVWHRNEELARYQQVLDRAALAAADGITANEFLDLRDEVTVAWNRALGKAIDSLSDLAVSLSAEQIERFELHYRERSEDFQDYMEKSEQQREIYRVNRAYKRLESWFGEFDYPLDERVLEVGGGQDPSDLQHTGHTRGIVIGARAISHAVVVGRDDDLAPAAVTISPAFF